MKYHYVRFFWFTQKQINSKVQIGKNTGNDFMIDKQKELEKKIFRLQAFCAIIVLVGGCIFLLGFSSDKKQKFDEVDVKRINIKDEDEKLRMVISNKDRQHPGMIDGKERLRKCETAGMFRENFATVQTNFWQEIQKNLSRTKYKEHLIIKICDSIQLIENEQIAYFQIQDTIPFAFDATGNKFPNGENLNQLEQILDPQMFFRINRSEMINLRFIERLEPYFNDRLMIRLRNSKIRLICSTNRTPNLRRWIEGEI